MDTRKIEKNERKAVIFTNIAYMLADIANGYAMDASSYARQFGKELMREERMKFNRMADAAKVLKNHCKIVTKEFYKVPSVDLACEESDFIADLILLIVDRVGDDANVMQKLRATIFNQFKSTLGIYDTRE